MDSRRRYRNKKRDEARRGPSPTAPVTIARREETRPAVAHPKILLKKDVEFNAGSGSSGSNTELPTSIKTIIISRSDRAGVGYTAAPNVCLPTSSSKEKTNGVEAAAVTEMQVPPQMTRCTPLMVAGGIFNSNARKLFHRSNTDFIVIGVLGAQGVGKSTLLNLLTEERPPDYDYYQHLFASDADDCIFPIRQRSKSPQQPQPQNVLRSRTETLQFFITRERYVLLDTAPVLAGCTAKEADHLELYTLSSMMQMLSVCHVLLLALDGISLEQLRLLHAALRLRPRGLCKGYTRNYVPKVIFVQMRAQRQHFTPEWRDQLERQLALLYESTNLPIHRGRGDACAINSFQFPQVSSNAATAHHATLPEVVRQFRERVLTTYHVSMCHSIGVGGGSDFSETCWFELLAETTRLCTAGSQHFEKIYAEIKLRHLGLRPKRRSDANWRKES